MKIYPIVKDGAVVGYQSSPVFTSAEGRPRIRVSNGYVGYSRTEVIRLAINNADIRRRIANLALARTVR